MVVNGIEQGIPKYWVYPVCMESFDLCHENTQDENDWRFKFKDIHSSMYYA